MHGSQLIIWSVEMSQSSEFYLLMKTKKLRTMKKLAIEKK